MRVAKDERADNHSTLLPLVYILITWPKLGPSLTDGFVFARVRSGGGKIKGKREKVKGVKNGYR